MATTTPYDREAAVQTILQPLEIAKIALEDQDCGICRMPYEAPSGETESHLPVQIQSECRHVFGEPCIVSWLMISERCAKCLRVILPDPKDEDLESWRRLREDYLERLRPLDTNLVNPAIMFLTYHTSTNEVPEPPLDFIIATIVDWPELLSDMQYQAARYLRDVRRMRRIRLDVFYECLELLILEDLEMDMEMAQWRVSDMLNLELEIA